MTFSEGDEGLFFDWYFHAHILFEYEQTIYNILLLYYKSSLYLTPSGVNFIDVLDRISNTKK